MPQDSTSLWGPRGTKFAGPIMTPAGPDMNQEVQKQVERQRLAANLNARNTANSNMGFAGIRR